MRKFKGFLTACVLAVAVAACGGQAQKPQQAQQQPAQQQPAQQSAQQTAKSVDLIMATGGTGGTYYPLGGAMAKVWKDNIPGLNVTVQSSAASVANIRLLAKKEVELALIQNDTAHYGYNSLEAFAEQKEKYTNFKAIAALYPEIVHIVVRADSPIKSIADLKGKKVVVGAPGSGNELNFRQIAGAYGLDYKTRKDVDALYLPFAEGATAFKDKNADALVLVTGVPAAPLAEVQTATPIRLLSIDGDALAKLKKDYPFFVEHTVKANTYKGQDQDVKTLAVLAILVAREDLDANLVYNLTRTLWEKQADIAGGHAKAKEFDLNKATQGLPIPLHPGAEKFYKEKGVLK